MHNTNNLLTCSWINLMADLSCLLLLLLNCFTRIHARVHSCTLATQCVRKSSHLAVRQKVKLTCTPLCPSLALSVSLMSTSRLRYIGQWNTRFHVTQKVNPSAVCAVSFFPSPVWKEKVIDDECVSLALFLLSCKLPLCPLLVCCCHLVFAYTSTFSCVMAFNLLCKCIASRCISPLFLLLLLLSCFPVTLTEWVTACHIQHNRSMEQWSSLKFTATLASTQLHWTCRLTSVDEEISLGGGRIHITSS